MQIKMPPRLLVAARLHAGLLVPQVGIRQLADTDAYLLRLRSPAGSPPSLACAISSCARFLAFTSGTIAASPRVWRCACPVFVRNWTNHVRVSPAEIGAGQPRVADRELDDPLARVTGRLRADVAAVGLASRLPVSRSMIKKVA